MARVVYSQAFSYFSKVWRPLINPDGRRQQVGGQKRKEMGFSVINPLLELLCLLLGIHGIGSNVAGARPYNSTSLLLLVTFTAVACNFQLFN